MVLVGAMRLPVVQTALVRYATEELSQMINQPIEIKAVDISWFDKLVLEGVSIKDSRKTDVIAVKQLIADFKLSSFIGPGKIVIEEVALDGAAVRLQTVNKEGLLNINEFIDNILVLLGPGEPRDKNLKPSQFIVNEVSLKNSFFSMDMDTEPHQPELGFDHYHFGFKDVSAHVSRLRIAADTFEIDVKGLKCTGLYNDFPVHKVNTFMRLTGQSMQFHKLHAELGKSFVRDSLVFNYEDFDSFLDFNKKVEIVARLDSSHVYSQDLAMFAPYLKRYEDYWGITGYARGTVENFSVKKMQLSFGKHTSMNGYVSFDGLPDFFSSYIQLKLKKANIYAEDLKQYFPGQDSYHYAQLFGRANGSVNFIGFPKDFVARWEVETNLGAVKTDINLKIKDSSDQSTYSGRLITKSFELGKLVGKESWLHQIDMDGAIKGSGFSANDVDLEIDTKIRRIGIEKYDYKNIIVQGRIRKQKYYGLLNIQDPNLTLTAEGDLDLSRYDWRVNMKMDLTGAQLDKLGFSDVPFFISSNSYLDLQRDKGAFLIGNAELYSTQLVYNNKYLLVDTIMLDSHLHGDSSRHDFTLRSDLLDFDAEGNYQFQQLAVDLPVLWKELKLSLSNNQNKIEEYYATKKAPANKYFINYYANLKDMNPLLDIFIPEVYVSPKTQIKGNYAYTDTASFELKTDIDEFRYEKYGFSGVNLYFDAFKPVKQHNTYAQLNLNVDKQTISNEGVTKDIDVNASWKDFHIDLDAKLNQIKYDNSAKLLSTIDFRDDGTTDIYFKELELKIDSAVWAMPEDNLLSIKGKEMNFSNLILESGEHQIGARGYISEDPDKLLLLFAKNFDLSTLNFMTQMKLSGKLNADARVHDAYNSLLTEALIDIDSLAVDGGLVGDVNGFMDWDNEKQVSNINGFLIRDGQKVLNLKGFVSQKDPEEQLHLKAVFNGTNVSLLEPFLSGMVSGVEGTASGDLDITGKFTAPKVNGVLNADKVRFKINYLNTVYSFTDKVYFENGKIVTKNLKLRDINNNVTVLNGGLYHDNFRDFLVDMDGVCKNFEILHTQAVNNDAYYGTALVSGRFSILGPFENIAIEGEFKSNKGTKIYIPLSSSSTVEQTSFLRYVNKAKPGQEKVKDSVKVDLSGVKLDLNMDITQDAYCEIIFDPRSGDIIKGTGHGLLNMKIDTKGDFSIAGKYYIDKGSYNFTMMNLVNKAFTIEPNSSIAWNGNPYGGILDIRSSYLQYASLLPIARAGSITSHNDTVTLQQRVPVTVDMTLKGNLLMPEIGLGITIKSYAPTIYNYIVDFYSRINSNEQEMNRQAFSLIVLQRFANETSLGASAGAIAGSSLSEMFSNQLSGWVSQLDENLQVDIILNGMSSEDLQNIRTRVSYMVLDGRLKLSADGGRLNSYNQTTGTSSGSFAVDWAVEYLILPNGNLRLKMYNKTRPNPLGGAYGNNANTITGFSLMNTESFDNLMELFSKKIREAKENETEPEKKENKKEKSEPTSMPLDIPQRRNETFSSDSANISGAK